MVSFVCDFGAGARAWVVSMPAAEQDLCGDGTLLKRVLREGAGKERPDLGASCCVHYVGTLASTGETFDSSRDRDKPLDFRAGSGVITGWSLAVCTMRSVDAIYINHFAVNTC